MKYYGVLDKGPHYMEEVDELPIWAEDSVGRVLYYNGDMYYSTIDGWIKQEGISGYSGYDGIDGNIAVSGYSGYSGHIGISGISGYSGKGEEFDVLTNTSSRSSYYQIKNGLLINYGWHYDRTIQVGTHSVEYVKPFEQNCYFSSAYLILTDVSFTTYTPIMYGDVEFQGSSETEHFRTFMHTNQNTYTSLTHATYDLSSNLTRLDFQNLALGFYWMSIGK